MASTQQVRFDVNDLPPPFTPITLSIAAVERDTGLSKDTLRVWERRYGFPVPARDAAGEREYPLPQVEKLRAIKRLMDAGHRPGRIVPLPMSQLQLLTEQTLAQPQRGAAVALDSDDLRAHLALIGRHDMVSLRGSLALLVAQVGVSRFVHEVVAPLNVAVGDAWLRGDLQVFEEHLYTETVQSVLRQVIGSLPPASAATRPRVLLTTFPGESHALGLLMAQAVLALDGCHCISLGTQTPIWDIVLASTGLSIDIVALSFTACLNPNQVVDGLAEMRSKLPGAVDVWAGGSAPVLHRRRVPGVQPMDTLQAAASALQAWRQARSPAT